MDFNEANGKYIGYNWYQYYSSSTTILTNTGLPPNFREASSN